jgi:hypothetical protein
MSYHILSPAPSVEIARAELETLAGLINLSVRGTDMDEFIFLLITVPPIGFIVWWMLSVAVMLYDIRKILLREVK